MAKNGLLLGSVAFGTSFGLSLLVSQNIKTALFTGLITVPAAFSGVAVVNRKQRTQQRLNLTALESQIYQMKRLETQLNQSLLAISSEKQRTEVNLNFLENQVNQLHTQIAEQRSYKQQLTQDSLAVEERKSRLELESRELQTQIQNCEQRRSELYQYIRTIKAEKQNLEVAFNSIQAEFDHLRVQVAELESQKQEAKRDVIVIESKPQLEELHLLQNQTQELEKQKTELNHVLSRIAHERNVAEADINLLQSQLSQLQGQILDLQINKDNLEQEITTLIERKLQSETDRQNEMLPEEWSKFGMQIGHSELQVLKVIVQREPSSAIKKIAEENTTMPELLIDSINELALNTIGDLIIDPGNDSSVSPIINNEYLTNVNKLLNVYLYEGFSGTKKAQN